MNSGQANDEEDGATFPTSDSRAKRPLVHYLYWSHFLSRWGDRMWEFAVGLLMITVWPDSLLLTAIYGLTEAASVAVFGVLVGNWVDRTPRLKVVQISLGLQNGSVIIAGLALGFLLAHRTSLPGGLKTLAALSVLVNVCGAISALAGLATDIVVERDWVVVISQQQSPGLLTQLNSVMRRIDLSCKLVAPVFIGFLMSSVSSVACALSIALWNLLSVGVEYKLLHSLYWSIPALQQGGPSRDLSLDSAALELVDLNLQNSFDEDIPLVDGEKNHSNSRGGIASRCLHLPYFQGWTDYFQQEVMLAGVALALLYFTVLSFGSLMTATLNWRGVPAYVLGLARGVAAIVGILATIVYPILQPMLHTVRTGLWSICIQWSLLSIAATSTFIRSGSAASVMLIVGVAASRFGLWMFDLSVTQLMQDSIPEEKRGVVFGVQNSLQSIMEMLSYVMAIIISDPKKFRIPVLMSYCSVGLAALLYAYYSYRVRGHLFHLDKLLRYLD
ncbi:hypothetical protein R1sor_007089 [Riccia sorocarpa]|uniref:Solute carrier family 40 member n=1 Tax=Riccia sorocarpa TaxID=122646 RepID=A0ABD3HPF3_9MARC